MGATLQNCLSKMPSLTEAYLREAVLQACATVDEEFLIRARHLDMMDGLTLILALVFPDPSKPGFNKLLVANVGDSRAVLGRAQQSADPESADAPLEALRLSEDHKPNRPDEKERIESRGGLMQHHGVWRVFMPQPICFAGKRIPRWGLAVSRAFGDLLLKEPEAFGCSGVTPGGLVIAEPELHCIPLDLTRDRFLVLACDSIWDVLRDEDAMAVCAGQAGAELAAHSLVRHAFAAGSGDNLTALVVALRTTPSS